jgi:hypothetical protein
MTKPKADLYRDVMHKVPAPDGVLELTNTIIALLRDRDDTGEVQFFALCNVIVSLMVLEERNRDFMCAVLNKSPWDEFAAARKAENDLRKSRPEGRA